MNDRPRIESASETSRTKVRRADFGCSILANVISIVDLDLGNRSVTNDIEHVLRRIEDYHQGSIAGCLIMSRLPRRVGGRRVGWRGSPFLPFERN